MSIGCKYTFRAAKPPDVCLTSLGGQGAHMYLFIGVCDCRQTCSFHLNVFLMSGTSMDLQYFHTE